MVKCEPEDTSATCTLSLSDLVSGMHRYKCSHCEKCYVSATDLHHHEEKHFEKEKLGYCSDYDKDFGSPCLLQQHKLTHAGGTP